MTESAMSRKRRWKNAALISGITEAGSDGRPSSAATRTTIRRERVRRPRCLQLGRFCFAEDIEAMRLMFQGGGSTMGMSRLIRMGID
jgi:hypothetical protein